MARRAVSRHLFRRHLPHLMRAAGQTVIEDSEHIALDAVPSHSLKARLCCVSQPKCVAGYRRLAAERQLLRWSAFSAVRACLASTRKRATKACVAARELRRVLMA